MIQVLKILMVCKLWSQVFYTSFSCTHVCLMEMNKKQCYEKAVHLKPKQKIKSYYENECIDHL